MNGGIYRESAASPAQDVLGMFAAKVYTWMTMMLLVTAGTSALAINQGVVQWFTQHRLVFLGALLTEVLLVGLFAMLRKSMSFFMGLFLVGSYTVLTGLTLSVVLARYQPHTVAVSFMMTALVFTSASLYGFIAKRSIEHWGSWLLLALLGLIGTMIVNMFLGSGIMDYVISCIAVVVFSGLAAYDAQMIQSRGRVNQSALTALDCALEVYLDFLNLFLHILRLFGMSNQKNN